MRIDASIVISVGALDAHGAQLMRLRGADVAETEDVIWGHRPGQRLILADGAYAVSLGVKVSQCFRKLAQAVDIIGFAAEDDGVSAGQGEDVHGRGSEKGGALYRVDGRQLQHQIHAMVQGRSCSFPLIGDGGLAALDEMRAHDRDEQVAAAFGAGLLDMKDMPIMERVVFDDDAADFHDPHLNVINIA